jgi:hypothetical protein
METVSQDISENESRGFSFDVIEPVLPTVYEHVDWSNV